MMTSTAFIIGSPRSGTTLLGDILDLHPQIGRWYEPYFILDRYFRQAPHDRLTDAEATPAVQNFVRRAFEEYGRRRGCQIVIDKSPRNSLKLPFLLAVFPQARFVHIVRDGRDATLSIHQQWQRRQRLGRRRISLETLRTVKQQLLDPQPLLKHKVAALCFELGGIGNLFTGRNLLHRVRWQGRLGWGPRFPGWEQAIDQLSLLEFNAWQWVYCLETIRADRGLLAPTAYLEIRYETLLQEPRRTLADVLDFLDVPFPGDLMNRLPRLKATNFGKWQTGFSTQEKAQIGPILHPLLVQLDYAKDDSWYRP